MYMAPRTTEEVYKILMSLRAKASSGYGSISTFILKTVGDAIATPLSVNINYQNVAKLLKSVLYIRLVTSVK